MTNVAAAAELIDRVIDKHELKVLNVAGPRLSGWKTGYAYAFGSHHGSDS